ncbi:DUF2232 domain-containing protein [Paenibacillus chungangensis]|uniref:DUF2232 domain-containing protein n=1 Tax=Paenibacillus chungangensis TaxID=696535 RepID=A0ABW3HW73_9BACL
MNGLKSGLKPVLWSGAALGLLLLLAVPGLNLPAMLLMMVPYAVLYATLPKASFVVHILPIWLIAALLLGPSFVLLLGLFFMVPGIFMGHMYRQAVPAAKVLRIVTIVILSLLMMELLLLEMVLDFSLLTAMKETIAATFNDVMAQSGITGWDEEMSELLVATIINMIPLTFIVMSFLYAVITHYIARRAVIGSGLEVPAFPEAKEWKLPRLLVVYYLIAYMVELVMPRGGDSFLAIALMNLVPLLSYVFAIQAIGFFFFIAHQRGWSKAVPIVIAIPVLLIPPLSLIGVLDTAFPMIRKSFTKQ